MNKTEIVNQFTNFLDFVTNHGCDQFQGLSNRVDDIHTNYNTRLDSVVTNLGEVEEKIENMLNDISNLKDEFANYQKVSIVKNLNQQLHERNIEVGHLQKKVAKLEADVAASNVVAEEEVVEEEVVAEEEVVEKEVVAEEEEVVAEEEVVEEEVVAEEVAVVEEKQTDVVEEEDDDEEGVSLVEKMLKGPKDKKKRMYFVTDDEDRDIYDVDEDGDPSEEPVGKLVGKTGRAKWF